MNREDIVAKISKSKKYSTLYIKTIERIVDDSIVKYGLKKAEEGARNVLHQIWGAYFSARPDWNKLVSLLESQTSTKNTKEICSNLLRLHKSSHERLTLLDEFYSKIFEITGMPDSILDLACGLNPLTFPWIDLPETSKYRAIDIDVEEIGFLNTIFNHLQPEFKYEIKLGDVISDELPMADIVFMFKLFQNLEQQKKGSALEVIKRLKSTSKYIIVSFPIASLSGKNKSMKENYSQLFETIAAQEEWNLKKLEFKTELVYIIS